MKLTNEIVIEKAKAIGFDLVGFAKAELLKSESEKLEEWLIRGYQAGMSYMERNQKKRIDVSQILPEAKSIISLAVNYYTDHQYTNNPAYGKVSRYAWGKDYHLIIWEMLERLEKELKKIDQAFESKSYIDTGPVMDKAWAVRSGIGWLGKNTNVINKELGSWIFIANIITNYEFDYTSSIPDFCGSCTACIDACPTDAIVQEYVIDSNKCISYLTIENKGELSQEFKGKFDNWLFGCDICQDVCPWNYKFAKQTVVSDFNPNNNNEEISLQEILNMPEKDFRERFLESPILRAKLSGLKRNAEFLSR
ncbi:tRNA epoxyqueuosine(34) reductase QueG [bacterium BMS3Abin03]|nr:tRNA epoxyqueuosine(34) reductase QueG [bacterium BMS3Abin03]